MVISTLHGVKGEEYTTVIAAGLLNGYLPHWDYIMNLVSAQREALQTLRCFISNLEYRFYKAYGMEIEDKCTVYGECTYRLVPREDEPSVCLMHDWIYLPSA